MADLFGEDGGLYWAEALRAALAINGGSGDAVITVGGQSVTLEGGLGVGDVVGDFP